MRKMMCMLNAMLWEGKSWDKKRLKFRLDGHDSLSGARDLKLILIFTLPLDAATNYTEFRILLNSILLKPDAVMAWVNLNLDVATSILYALILDPSFLWGQGRRQECQEER